VWTVVRSPAGTGSWGYRLPKLTGRCGWPIRALMNARQTSAPRRTISAYDKTPPLAQGSPSPPGAAPPVHCSGSTTASLFDQHLAGRLH
jgi:hypothetical protein